MTIRCGFTRGAAHYGDGLWIEAERLIQELALRQRGVDWLSVEDADD